MMCVGDVSISHKCMGHPKQSVRHARHCVEVATMAYQMLNGIHGVRRVWAHDP
jgi:hypothetical protein